jgi:hypothetical protein
VSSLLDRPLKTAALEYARLGLAVLPCGVRGKEPATRRGLHEATSNPMAIERWWRAREYNVAIRTGAVSGLWVVDIDGAVGRDSLAELQARHGALPTTAVSITRNGFHLWWRYIGPVPSSAARIAPGIDVRADGAYAVAPPSVHPSGHLYSWTDDAPTGDLPNAPDWLVRLARARPQIEVTPTAVPREGTPSAYGQAALERELAILAATPAGARNHALNRAAFRLFQLVAGGELDRDSVVAGLVDASQRNRLVAEDGMRSVMVTIRSGERAGMLFPRSRGAA